jgi:hypothetical protein
VGDIRLVWGGDGSFSGCRKYGFKNSVSPVRNELKKEDGIFFFLY